MEIAATINIQQPNSADLSYDFHCDIITYTLTEVELCFAYNDPVNVELLLPDDKYSVFETSLILNWKIWEYFNNGNRLKALKFKSIWLRYDELAQAKLQGTDLEYYQTQMRRYALAVPNLKA